MTPAQARCLEFIRSYVAARGFAPSYDEIVAAMGRRSKAVAVRLVGALEAQGHIRRLPYRARSLEVIERPSPPRLRAAALELAAAAREVLDLEDQGRLRLPRQTAGRLARAADAVLGAAGEEAMPGTAPAPGGRPTTGGGSGAGIRPVSCTAPAPLARPRAAGRLDAG